MTGQVSKRSLEDIPQLIIPRKLRSPSSLSDNILIPQHQFTETGPNGTHVCIASPFCGPSVLQIPEYLSQIQTEDLRRHCKTCGNTSGHHRSTDA
jgi:hypothetical protein